MHEENPGHKVALPVILSILDESEEEVRALGIDPQDLVEIYNDYLNRQDELAEIGAFISRTLLKAGGVHSVTYRAKASDHLIKKIVRKKREYPERHTTIGNYLDLINDLVGVRVLHLYKENWTEIGEYIQSKWDLKRPPYAYVKNTTEKVSTRAFARFGCKVLTHPSGYQAIHYVIETKPDKQRYFVEVQLRTLFDEGWSEIDHSIRYPDHQNSELLDCMLHLLNKLTTQANEMASHLRKLTYKLNEHGQGGKKSDLAAELHAFVDKLQIPEDEKQLLYTCINKITGEKEK